MYPGISFDMVPERAPGNSEGYYSLFSSFGIEIGPERVVPTDNHRSGHKSKFNINFNPAHPSIRLRNHFRASRAVFTTFGIVIPASGSARDMVPERVPGISGGWYSLFGSFGIDIGSERGIPTDNRRYDHKNKFSMEFNPDTRVDMDSEPLVNMSGSFIYFSETSVSVSKSYRNGYIATDSRDRCPTIRIS